MLVLSRKTDEKILLPAINAAIQVVEIRPGVVRLGIEAPAIIQVLRQELANEQTRFGHLLTKPAHAFRNQLNSVSLALSLLRRQVRKRNWQEIEDSLNRLDEAFEPIQSQMESKTPAVEESSTTSLLLVEDNDNERMLMESLLRAGGMDVAAVTTGRDALTAVQKRRPDVILLDLGLPDMDGTKVIRAIHEQLKLPNQRIWVISGQPPQSGAPGVERWIQKPVRGEQLLDQLTHV